MEIKLARALVAIFEKICGNYLSLSYVTMRIKGLFIIKQQGKTINNQNRNPKRWNANIFWASLGLVGDRKSVV